MISKKNSVLNINENSKSRLSNNFKNKKLKNQTVDQSI
jgi:hypothetical protein